MRGRIDESNSGLANTIPPVKADEAAMKVWIRNLAEKSDMLIGPNQANSDLGFTGDLAK